MIFYTIHNISIRKYSVMDATRDIRLVSKIPLPIWACRKAFEKLQIETGILFDKEILDKDILRLTIYNRIVMYRAALLIMTYGKNKEIEDWYKNFFGGDFNGKTLKDEIERLEFRYKELKDKNTDSKQTFEDLIANVEALLGYSINRNSTLYEFKFIYDSALKKNKALNKKNG